MDELFNDIENPERADQKVSFSEKAVLLALYSVGRIALRKLRKANTYGDLTKIMTAFDTSMERAEAADADGGEPEKKFNDFITDLKKNL